MTEKQYNAKCKEIESEIEVLDRDMSLLKDEILQSRVTGDYSKVNDGLELFLKKANRMAELVKERTVLRREVKQNGFTEESECSDCSTCDCYDPDMGCTMPSIHKSYACPESDKADETEAEIDCRNYFCEGDRVKAGYMGKLAEATVVCVTKDFFVLLFDQSYFVEEMYEKPELYEVFTVEYIDLVEKI